MKNFNFLMVLLALTLFVTSCSKEEDATIKNDPANKAILSFGAILHDLTTNKAALKQVIGEIPDCSDDAPAFVEVILSQDGLPVVGDLGEPLRVNVNPNPGDYDGNGIEEYFTDESSELELAPGIYSLDYFTVLNADEEIIWVSPVDNGASGSFSNFVNTPLPLNISLNAGVKKYVDVEVLCFDNRTVNEYGYMFFDFTAVDVLTFCVFGNVCNDTGRHFPANFRFDVWSYSGNPESPKGKPLFDETNPYINETGLNEAGNLYASPLCVALPDTSNPDFYYGEISLIEENGHRLIRSGVFSDEDVSSLFDETSNTVEPYHFREGPFCGDDNPLILNSQNNDD